MWAIAAWLLGAGLWLTWIPFVGRAASSAEPLRMSLDPLEIGVNIMLFAPFALAVALATPGSWGRRVRISILVVGCASALAEIVQAWLPGRTTALQDWILNSFGGFLAAVFGARVRDRARIHLARGIGFAGLAVMVAYLGFSSVSVHQRLALSDWRPEFPLVAADEVGGQRAYAGVVERARLCAGRGESLRCASPGAGSDATPALVQAALSSQRFSVNARVLSHSNQQKGPARILSLSRDAMARNATLGQEGRDVVLRFRSRLTGGNGARPEFWLRNGVVAGRPTRLDAEYDRGKITIRSESGERVVAGAVTAGILQGWMLQQPRALFGDMFWDFDVRTAWRGAAATALLLFAPVGYVVARATPARTWRRAMAGFVAGPLLLIALDAPRIAFPLPDHLVMAAAGALVGALAQHLVHVPRAAAA